MAAPRTRIVQRPVEAVQIPAGTPITLPAGTEVDLVQVLGGNYTLAWRMGMVRLSGRQADAIGETLSAEHAAAPAAADGPGTEAPPENVLWDKLKAVYDPEIPVNIVDLGLVYSLSVSRDEAAPAPHHRVDVAMTLTAPGCGMGPTIAEDARQKLLSVPGVAEAKVALVWDPPWNQSMISEEGKMILGLV